MKPLAFGKARKGMKAMRKKVLWIIGIVAVLSFAVTSFFYLKAQIDEQRQEHEFLELKLEEALAPEPKILYASLTYEEVKQAAAAGDITCVGSYPFLYLDTTGDPAQFTMAAGGSQNTILLEKGVDVFPELLQTFMQYTVCRDPNNGGRVVWIHPSDFPGVKKLKERVENP